MTTQTGPGHQPDKAGAPFIRIIGSIETAKSEMTEPALLQVFKTQPRDGDIIRENAGCFRIRPDVAQIN